jgi:hypothetical protein
MSEPSAELTGTPEPDETAEQTQPPSLFDVLLERVSQAQTTWVRVAATWHEHDSAWKLALLDVVTGAPPDTWAEECWEYEHAVLDALEASGKTVARWFARGQVEVGSATVALTVQQGIHPERRDSRASGIYQPLPWPSITWRTQTTDTTAPLHDVLVAAGTPAFINFDQAAAAFFRTPQQSNRRFDGHEIVIREQDPRARIERVRIRAAELVVSVGGNDCAGKRLTLSGRTGASQELDADTSQWSLPLPDGLPDGAWLALHDDTQLLDSRALDPSWRPPGDVEFEIEPATRVEAQISRGEGSTLEFKRELPGEDPSRVMKTVAAFANGMGGTIIFGVTDEQKIIGLGDALTREAIDHLTRLISDHVQPHPPFEIERIAVGDSEILAVYVSPGSDTPYGVGTSDRKLIYYVRRGGNSSPARPEDIRNAVRSRMPTDDSHRGGLF